MQNPNDHFQKYFTLMWLLLASVLGFLLLLVALFYILKLFSVAMFNIPGSGYFFRIVIVIIPYLILFSAYYLVFKKIANSVKNASALVAGTVLTAGSLLCLTGLVFALLQFFNFRYPWLTTFSHFANYSFAAHLIIILISAGILATGDPKEKSWLERDQPSV